MRDDDLSRQLSYLSGRIERERDTGGIMHDFYFLL